MNKIYLVKYWGGDWDSEDDNIIFATPDKKTATKYVKKFNSLLKKWKAYYKQFEYDNHDVWGNWIKEEHVEQHFTRWNQLRNVTKCYYDEVEVR